MSTFDDIADAVISSPGIATGFVQQTRGIEAFNAVKNSGGGWDHGHRRTSEFRCVISDGSQTVECAGTDIAKAVRSAFQSLGVAVAEPLDKALKTFGGVKAFAPAKQPKTEQPK